jgi:hypothetical protein
MLVNYRVIAYQVLNFKFFSDEHGHGQPRGQHQRSKIFLSLQQGNNDNK